MGTVLAANDITKKYNKNIALNGFEIKVEQGDIYGFVGNNGAGKTTFMKIIMGLSKMNAGGYELFRVAHEKMTMDTRMRVSAIIETPSFYPYLTGYQNLKLHQMAMGHRVLEEEIMSILDKVNIRKEAQKKVKNYSLGMKQRLGLGRALLSRAELVVLDEPTNGLDPSGIVELRNLILLLNKEQGTTFLVSSHHILELANFISKLGIIKNGQMVEETDYKNLTRQLEAKNENIENYIMRMAN